MRHKKIIIIILSILILIAIISGITFNKIRAKDTLIKNEASKIVSILKKIDTLNQLYDINNQDIIDEEIEEHDKILEELHQENSSGNISDERLESIIDNSISAVKNHKSGLNSFKNGDLNTYSEFIKKSDENILQITNEMERLGFTK